MYDIGEFEDCLRRTMAARDERVRKDTLRAVAEGIYKGLAESSYEAPHARAALLTLAKALEESARA